MDVVDFDLKFIYILTGWESFVHDTLILANDLERDDGLTIHPGNHAACIVLGTLGSMERRTQP